MSRVAMWKKGVYCREKGRFNGHRKVRKVVSIERDQHGKLSKDAYVVWRDVTGWGECSLGTMRAGWEVISKQ